MKYKIYQINFSRKMIERINNKEETALKIYYIYLHTMGLNPQPENIMDAVSLYRHVADIEIDGDHDPVAKDWLEMIFHIGNMGPEHHITRHRQMHSLSVGDVIVLDDEAWYVASFGFNKLPDFVEMIKELHYDHHEAGIKN